MSLYCVYIPLSLKLALSLSGSLLLCGNMGSEIEVVYMYQDLVEADAMHFLGKVPCCMMHTNSLKHVSTA